MEVVIFSILGGMLVAVPAMGPASAISIRRILVGRERKGLAFAAGYIAAEGLACLTAVWGVELVFYAIPMLEPVLRWIGILLLLAVGVYFAAGIGLSRTDRHSEREDEPATLGGEFAFGFGMTALNPALIAGWTTGLGVVLSTTGIDLAVWQKWFLPFGIVVGETLWYVILVAAARRFDELLDERVIGRMVRGIGTVLVALAAWTGWQTLTGGI